MTFILMNDVIDRIALMAEQNFRDNVVENYCCPNGYNLLKPEEIVNGLSLERVGELNQEIILRQHLPSPRLTTEEIDAILSDYPFKLPVEFYDLYQRGNGVLPIGLGDTAVCMFMRDNSSSGQTNCEDEQD